MAGTASAVRTSLVGKAASGSECMSSGLSSVTAGQPNQSLLYLELTDIPPCGSCTPPTRPLSAAELDHIRTWIMNARPRTDAEGWTRAGGLDAIGGLVLVNPARQRDA
jgi:hypothetical protein